ncbi:hypothetical protein ACFL34_05015 [Candidatus Sumerlaeota bacterium]
MSKPSLPDFSRERKIADELELLGYSPDKHPLELFDCSGCLEAVDIPRLLGRRVWLAGWLIAAKLTATRKDKRFMKFLTLEDLTATYEATLFPRVYEKYGRLTNTHGPFRLHGTVADDQGALFLNCDRLELLEPRHPQSPRARQSP